MTKFEQLHSANLSYLLHQHWCRLTYHRPHIKTHALPWSTPPKLSRKKGNIIYGDNEEGEGDHGRPRCRCAKCIVAGVDGPLMVKSPPTMEAPQALDKLGFGLDMF